MLQQNLPNWLTSARVLMAVVFFVVLTWWRWEDSAAQKLSAGLSMQADRWLLLAAGLFIVAGLTDIADGYLARKWKVESAFGRIMDPFADKVLVLGAGLGRESLVLAERGYRVLGLDLARRGLTIGASRGQSLAHPPAFVQADFLRLPIRPASVGTVLVPSVMYSAVPGRARRRAWIEALRTCLKPDGRMILNFLIAREPETTLTRSIRTGARLLLHLPGSNSDYQPGDACTNGHFMHVFQTERELREELAGTRAQVVAIHWTDGFAVLS